MSRSRVKYLFFVFLILFWGLGCSPENQSFKAIHSESAERSESGGSVSTEEPLSESSEGAAGNSSENDQENEPETPMNPPAEETENDEPPATQNPPQPSPNGGPCGDIDFSSQQLNEAVYEMCLLVNKERAAQGLSPLVIQQSLSDVAWLHAKDMHDRSYFSHTNLEGESPFDRMRTAGITFRGGGENISAGRSSASKTMTGWMNSPGHRANILKSGYDNFGIGYFSGTKGYKGYWVQVFNAD